MRNLSDEGSKEGQNHNNQIESVNDTATAEPIVIISIIIYENTNMRNLKTMLPFIVLLTQLSLIIPSSFDVICKDITNNVSKKFLDYR